MASRSHNGLNAPSRRAQISVCGAAYSDPELDVLAEAVGRGIAEAGVTLVCGGGPGVMEASARGARSAGGEVIGILRSDSLEEANPYCTHLVATGIGQGRNLAVAASGDVVIAIGGAWGTLSEIAFARRLGRTVVALDSWSVSGRGEAEGGPGLIPVENPEQAVAVALEHLPDLATPRTASDD